MTRQHHNSHYHSNHNLKSRRTFLGNLGMGFSGVALGSMLMRDQSLRASEPEKFVPPDGKPHFAPKAKNVIFIFLAGGLSHLESFDPKPALNKYAGQEIGKTPHKDVLDASFIKDNLRIVVPDDANGQQRNKLYPLQIGYKKRGQSGIEISDWFPNLGGCVDDMAIIRSMWTTDNNHGAQYQFHSGRHVLDGLFPTVGSWIHYGLGSLNDNLPSFVVLGKPIADCCGGLAAHGASYLGPEHSGIRLGLDPKNPLAYSSPASDVYKEEQQREFSLLNSLHQLSAAENPDDAALRARIKSYELAFRMQTALPEVVDITRDTEQTHKMYGLDRKETAEFGKQCLVARHMVEKGVRYVQIFHGTDSGAGAWDSHDKLKQNHSRLCNEVDQPLSALLKDLKRTGLLKETLIVIGTEFGRTPGSQGSDGRDHHPFGFSVAMAGGGIKGGIAHGRTDELGFHAVEDRHYVTDIHATLFKQLGIDPHRLEIPGRKRLDIDYGEPINAIIS